MCWRVHYYHLYLSLNADGIHSRSDAFYLFDYCAVRTATSLVCWLVPAYTLYMSVRRDDHCCGWEAQCGQRTKINWTTTADCKHAHVHTSVFWNCAHNCVVWVVQCTYWRPHLVVAEWKLSATSLLVLVFDFDCCFMSTTIDSMTKSRWKQPISNWTMLLTLMLSTAYVRHSIWSAALHSIWRKLCSSSMNT